MSKLRSALPIHAIKLEAGYDEAYTLGPIRFRGSSFRMEKLVRWCNRPLCPLVFELHEDRASHEW